MDNIQQLYHLSPSSLGPVGEHPHFTNEGSHDASCVFQRQAGSQALPLTPDTRFFNHDVCQGTEALVVLDGNHRASLTLDPPRLRVSHMFSYTMSNPCARFQRHAQTPSPQGLSPVCHHVSTSVHLLSPTTLWSHSQASKLIGSPTETRKRKNNIKDLINPKPFLDRFLQGKQF